MKITLKTLLACSLTLLPLQKDPVSAAGVTSQNATDAHVTVWDGIYSVEQATRGGSEFQVSCLRCHRSDVDATNPDARLLGKAFMSRWREYDIESFFSFLKASMPHRDPGSLPDESYTDIVAHVLYLNKFPSGEKELLAESLDGIQIEGLDGPKPVPSGALVQLVGCLNQDEKGGWALTEATEPRRTDTAYSSTEEEMDLAELKALGIKTFRLQSMDFLADLDPTEHLTHKMQTKGYLIRQPNSERIDLTAMQAVGFDCAHLEDQESR